VVLPTETVDISVSKRREKAASARHAVVTLL
jgi:hypothetical protein